MCVCDSVYDLMQGGACSDPESCRQQIVQEQLGGNAQCVYTCTLCVLLIMRFCSARVHA